MGKSSTLRVAGRYSEHQTLGEGERERRVNKSFSWAFVWLCLAGRLHKRDGFCWVLAGRERGWARCEYLSLQHPSSRAYLTLGTYYSEAQRVYKA